jgi:hypothetical protein
MAILSGFTKISEMPQLSQSMNAEPITTVSLRRFISTVKLLSSFTLDNSA